MLGIREVAVIPNAEVTKNEADSVSSLIPLRRQHLGYARSCGGVFRKYTYKYTGKALGFVFFNHTNIDQ